MCLGLRFIIESPRILFWLSAGVCAGFVAYALHTELLSPLVVGAWHKRQGLDFFSVPQAFLNWKEHGSLFANRAGYGPYSIGFVFHPILAFVVGSWISLFEPWTAYWVFVGLSMGMLVASVHLLFGISGRTRREAMLYPALFLLPTSVYLMLWNAQMHVFLVLGTTLVLVGLFRGARYRELDRIGKTQVCTGMLLSVFSKPLLLVALPVLVQSRTLRRPLAMTLLAYFSISVWLLTNDSINPGNLLEAHGYIANTLRPINQPINGINHWSAIQAVLLGSNFSFWDKELLSLPVLLGQFIGRYSLLFLIPSGLISAWVFGQAILQREVPSIRLHLSLLLISIAILCYYLGYSIVWEYHYASAIPLISILGSIAAQTREQEANRSMRWARNCLVLTLLPTTYFVFGDGSPGAVFLHRCCKIVPVSGAIYFGVRATLCLLRNSDQKRIEVPPPFQEQIQTRSNGSTD